MTHMVMFRSADGKPGYHHTDSLDEAIGFVEHLRNQEQVPEARIFRMEEIPIAVKTYYKVEVSTAQPAQPAKTPTPSPAPMAPTATASPSAAPSASPAPTASVSSPPRDKVTVPEEPVVIEPMAPSNGGLAAGPRFGRFNRS